MFAGTFECRMDRQGRVAIPAAFRRRIEDSGDSFVLTFFDDAIAGYPRGTWLSLENQVLALPAFSKKARALSRVLASRAHESRLDAQGRLLVPPALRRLAGLDRDVVVIGAMDRFEIWPKGRWSSFASEAEALLDAASTELSFGPHSPSTVQA
ncbi:MAG: division/cell wall cluster transcriptional repressor MraZ [Vicinamibacteria bacterium]